MKSYFFLAFVLGFAASELTLLGPTLTPFGSWEDWQNCPEGTFVTAADVRIKKRAKDDFHRASTTRYDDYGLISVVLQCDPPPGSSGGPARSFIFSKVPGVVNMPLGRSAKPAQNRSGTQAEQVQYSLPLRNACSGVAVGYQLMIQTEQVAVDNAGATNLRIFCSELKTHGTNQFIEAYGEHKGEWTEEQQCRNRQAICGIQTLGETVDDGHYDNTAINNIRLRCCDLPNPATTCTPTDEWQLIQECDSRYSDAKAPCTYLRNVGISTTKSEDFTTVYDFNESNGFSLESEDAFWVQNGLAENFHNYNYSSATGFAWENAGDETFGEGSPEVVEFELEPRMTATVHQTVGKCSYFVARAPRIQVETKLYGTSGELLTAERKIIE